MGREKKLESYLGNTLKIYSLDKPETQCIAKGKEHKKYEFGAKASVAVGSKHGVIVGAKSFVNNIHDSRTLPVVVDQIREVRGKKPKVLIADRGYRGGAPGPEIKLVIPETGKGKKDSEKRVAKTRFRRRSKVEAVIGHLKSDYRLLRNYLKGTVGDAINLMLAATAYNCKKWMREMAVRPLFIFFWRYLYVDNMVIFVFSKVLRGDFAFANGYEG